MNKKFFFSLFAIMVVAALSFGFASCSSSDDDENPTESTVGTYKVAYQITDKGTLDDETKNILEEALNKATENLVYTNTQLKYVKEAVKKTIDGQAAAFAEAYPDDTFTVVVSIKDSSNKAVAQWTIRCDKGKGTVQ